MKEIKMSDCDLPLSLDENSFRKYAVVVHLKRAFITLIRSTF